MKPQLDKYFATLINTHNRLSDQKWPWFPFLFLKLQPHELLTFIQWVKMTFCFGLYFAFAYCLKDYFFSREIDIFQGLLKGHLGFGLWFGLVTRPLWNSRAKKLSSNGDLQQ